MKKEVIMCDLVLFCTFFTILLHASKEEVPFYIPVSTLQYGTAIVKSFGLVS